MLIAHPNLPDGTTQARTRAHNHATHAHARARQLKTYEGVEKTGKGVDVASHDQDGIKIIARFTAPDDN